MKNKNVLLIYLFNLFDNVNDCCEKLQVKKAHKKVWV